MLRGGGQRTTRKALGAGLGGIAFGALTVIALVLSNSPGGNYSASQIADYLAKGHRIAVIISFCLALLGVLGLISMLAYLRDSLG